MKSLTKRKPTVTAPANPQSAWATRCEIWRRRVERASARRTKRAKPQSALILAGHGVSLRIHGGALEIKSGLTHYPQQRETYLFFRGDVDLPERIILLDCSGSVSFDVLSWLNEQNVSLIRINWMGEIVCVAGASGYSANPFRVKWQLETRENPALRIEYCRSIISQKIETSIATLEKSIRRSEIWERAISVAYAALTRLDAGEPNSIVELRALAAR
jgi:CRISP-associated protein Cas1